MWIKWTVLIFLILVTGLMAVNWLGGIAWHRRTANIVGDIHSAFRNHSPAMVDFAELDDLPLPVQRYFRYVLRDGQPLIRAVVMKQRGGFRTSPGADWADMDAVEHFFPLSRAFVWDADIRMAPLFTVRVRDMYRSGEGSMYGKLGGLVTVVDESGDTQLNIGALQRYLAEAVWFPTALLPSQGVQWDPIDDSTAMATLSDGGNTASLMFRFNDRGEVASISTEKRARAVNGGYQETPWTCYVENYQIYDGIRVPSVGAVEWQLPEGVFDYWRGVISELQFDFVGNERDEFNLKEATDGTKYHYNGRQSGSSIYRLPNK